MFFSQFTLNTLLVMYVHSLVAIYVSIINSLLGPYNAFLLFYHLLENDKLCYDISKNKNIITKNGCKKRFFYQCIKNIPK